MCHRLLRTVERVQDVPKVDTDLGQIRLNGERLLIVGSGLFKPAYHVKNRTEFFVRLDVIRIDGKRAFVVDNRFFGTIVRRK